MVSGQHILVKQEKKHSVYTVDTGWLLCFIWIVYIVCWLLVCVYRIIVFTYIEINSIIYFRPFCHGGKQTLYLVDTVAMVAQQALYIRHLTDLSVGEYVSVDTVDMFGVEDWKQQFQGNQVDVTSLCIL